jgi:uncharacterized membrane protein
MSRGDPPAVTPRRHWRVSVGVFTARPKLLTALGVGLAVGLACLFLAPQLRPSSCAVAGWNAFCVLYLAFVFAVIRGKAPYDIRARAAIEDEGGGVILVLIVAACAASIAAVALELTLAKQDQGAFKAVHVATAFLTVTLSWLLMQTVYALHYAHEYYAADRAAGGDAGGLAFPGGEDPDYWDFLHFAVVVGVAAQTADIAFTHRRMRRLGTAHSLIAFVVNTLIVALTINLVAGLF